MHAYDLDLRSIYRVRRRTDNPRPMIPLSVATWYRREPNATNRARHFVMWVDDESRATVGWSDPPKGAPGVSGIPALVFSRSWNFGPEERDAFHRAAGAVRRVWRSTTTADQTRAAIDGEVGDEIGRAMHVELVQAAQIVEPWAPLFEEANEAGGPDLTNEPAEQRDPEPGMFPASDPDTPDALTRTVAAADALWDELTEIVGRHGADTGIGTVMVGDRGPAFDEAFALCQAKGYWVLRGVMLRRGPVGETIEVSNERALALRVAELACARHDEAVHRDIFRQRAADALATVREAVAFLDPLPLDQLARAVSRLETAAGALNLDDIRRIVDPARPGMTVVYSDAGEG